MKKDEKIHVNIVVIGHVDSGKSTTTGHLIYKCGGVDKRTIEKFEKDAVEMGRASFHYAWVLDKTVVERSRGITISCTTKQLQTPNVDGTIIDAPGHLDFIKNLITGASQADVALIMIPASRGAFESAVGPKGTFRQQVTLAKTVGLIYCLVIINKMDTVEYSQERYEEVRAEVFDRLKRTKYRMISLAFMPASGLVGDNLMEISTNMPWFKGWEYTYINPDKSEKIIKGHTIYDWINTLQQPARADNKDLRGCIADSFKIGGVGTVTVGRVDSGIMKPGDVLYISPADITSEVKSIEMHHKQLALARPGDNIGFNLKNVAVKDVRGGNVFGKSTANPPRECERFTAQVVVLEKIGDNRGLREHMAPVMDIHTTHIPIRIDKIVSVAEKKDKKKAKGENSAADEAPTEEVAVKAIKKDETGMVEIVPLKPVSIEAYSDYPGLGRFSIRDSSVTIAVGVVKSVQRKEEKGGKVAAAVGVSKPKKAGKGRA